MAAQRFETTLRAFQAGKQAGILARRPQFYIVALDDLEKTYQIPGMSKYDPPEGPAIFQRKCSVCLDPATHKEITDKDSSYVRYYCELCMKKNISPLATLYNAQLAENAAEKKQ